MRRHAWVNCMAYPTLATAAAAVGRNRSSISRAIKSGKLSATRDEVTGAWIIDPAELHRLYPPVDARDDAWPDARPDARPDAEARMGDAQADVHTLLRRAEIAEARLADARDQIEDLRQERDRLLSLHEADQRLLADLREKPQPQRRWWHWGR